MALSATLHCLTGCAIGEIAGLMIGTAIGLGFGAAISIVFAADTLSIATMEVVDNAVMALIPGAMDAGLVNATFWISMMIALTAAFFAAYPVNRYLLQRGKGHALTHGFHGAGPATGARRFIPTLATPTLVAAIVAFMLGSLVVSIAAELDDGSEDEAGGSGGHASSVSVPR